LNQAFSVRCRYIHLKKEFLWPPLRASGMLSPVLVMRREQGEIWRAGDAFETNASPDRGRQLLEQLDHHHDQEETIIYPEGDTRLNDDTGQRRHEFIGSGGMPAGWACRTA
jgi:regulator of cell morphogenesis and NO signaling